VAWEGYPLAEEMAMIMKIIMADEDVSDKIWVCGWENDADGSTKVGWEWYLYLAQELAKIMKIIADDDGETKN